MYLQLTEVLYMMMSHQKVVQCIRLELARQREAGVALLTMKVRHAETDGALRSLTMVPNMF